MSARYYVGKDARGDEALCLRRAGMPDLEVCCRYDLPADFWPILVEVLCPDEVTIDSLARVVANKDPRAEWEDREGWYGIVRQLLATLRGEDLPPLRGESS